MGYNVQLQGLDGFNSINNMLFTTVLVMLLMPYVSISLFTADKQMYIADASARRYRASAYYCAKVGSRSGWHWRTARNTHAAHMRKHCTVYTSILCVLVRGCVQQRGWQAGWLLQQSMLVQHSAVAHVSLTDSLSIKEQHLHAVHEKYRGKYTHALCKCLCSV